jgi:valyl-tRNA synthetase
MRVRYENWVSGLNGDWLISRQRFFGVPFPIWYRVDDAGKPCYDEILVPDEAALPVDPSIDTPPGFAPDQRDQPGGFAADPDVMDTWATSSLTPQIAGRWCVDGDLFARVFPMDLRPQAHEIIRTWLFSTVVRSHSEHGTLPWRHAAISGWILDPDRKKMSKSVGNALTPMGMLASFGSDAVRYWAASGRPGADTAFDEGQMKVGRRLALKLLNASKFVLGLAGSAAETAESAESAESAGSAGPGGRSGVTEALDRALLAELAAVVDEATTAFDAYDYTRALECTERFFWTFCDDYVELVKQRAYGAGGGASSARAALTIALSTQLRLFAPILPFAAEEAWSWWHDSSVHRESWPTAQELQKAASGGETRVLSVASTVIAAIRKAKSEAKMSMRTPVAVAVVSGTDDVLALVTAAQVDVQHAGLVERFELRTAAAAFEPEVEVVLAPQ